MKINMKLIYGDICTGISAATVALRPLGWQAAWFAEIEPFPCKVLHHHYGSGRPMNMPDPDEVDQDGKPMPEKVRAARRAAIKSVSSLPPASHTAAGQPPNYGDFTRIAAMIYAGTAPTVDVLLGGTPCQAFSIAGLRNSMADARGQLTQSFVELADAIDTVRNVRGEPAVIVVWENVPGVLSTKDNAFGCFLGALAGEDCELEPPRDSSGRQLSWPNAGCVFGPKRTVAWRVTDAQYFGVAQRRRRVFVVASARDGFDPTEVLFEFDGVRRDIAPSREARQDVAGTISSRTTGGGGLGTDFELAGGLQPSRHGGDGGTDGGVICMAHGQGGAEIARERRTTLTCNHEAPIIVGTLQSSGKAAGSATQQDAEAGMLVPIAFNARQDPASWMDRTRPLDTDGSTHAVCFSRKDHDADATVELAPTMRAMNHTGSHANGGGQLAVAFRVHGENSHAMQCGGVANVADHVDIARCLDTNGGYAASQGGNVVLDAVCVTGTVTHCLKAEGFDASEDGTGRGQPIVAAYGISPDCFDRTGEGANGTAGERSGLGIDFEIAYALKAKRAGGVASGMAVRRLTPREGERLQAFPDDYTAIPGPLKHVAPEKLDHDYIKYLMRGGVLSYEQCMNAAADGPRYKAIGNSMCTENVAWIGRRIERALMMASVE